MMNFKSQFSVVSFAAVAIALAGAASASAEDITFTCGTGTYVSPTATPTAADISIFVPPAGQPNGTPGTLTSNVCAGSPPVVPISEDNDLLSSYVLGSVNISSTGFELYNDFQGDLTAGGVGQGPAGPAQPPSPEPSLAAMSGAPDSITLTDSSGNGLFTFDSVDLQTGANTLGRPSATVPAQGFLAYTITGINTLLPAGQQQVFVISNTPSGTGCSGGSTGNGVCITTPSVDITGETNPKEDGWWVQYVTVSSNTNTYNYSGDKINELVISATAGSGDFGLLDQVQFNQASPAFSSVPEGGAGFMYLLLACGACCGAMFFKRNGLTA
jgi:hypothetical protein